MRLTHVWNRGGVVGTVCHGPAILPGIIDAKTGKSIIAGRTVTGFMIEGELIFRILDKLRADDVVPVVEAVRHRLKSAGRRWTFSRNPFAPNVCAWSSKGLGARPSSSRQSARTLYLACTPAPFPSNEGASH